MPKERPLLSTAVLMQNAPQIFNPRLSLKGKLIWFQVFTGVMILGHDLI